jgi:phosphatidylglycerophosphate synthase
MIHSVSIRHYMDALHVPVFADWRLLAVHTLVLAGQCRHCEGRTQERFKLTRRSKTDEESAVGQVERWAIDAGFETVHSVLAPHGLYAVSVAQGGMIMGIYATKAKWQKGLEGAVALCVRMRIQPDVLTYGALALAFAAGSALVLAGSNRAWLWLVPPCIIARLVFNLMDGQVARAQGLADRWGQVKNEFGDRLADAVIFLGLCVGGYADARLAAVVVVLVLCVSYLGILAQAVGGARVYSGLFGKGDRMISLAAFTLWPLSGGELTDYNWYLALAAAAAAATIVQRLGMIHGNAESIS